MDSPTLNDVYKQVSYHFSLKQNPTPNYLAPNQELQIEGWAGRQHSFVFDLQPKLSASKNAWKETTTLAHVSLVINKIHTVIVILWD